MQTSAAIREAVYLALDDLNAQLPPARRLPRSETTPLAGEDGQLDSLGVVNLIALVEQKLETHSGITVDLIDSDLLAGGEALNSVATLIEFVASLVNERTHV
jgi:acyl carrier protein